MTFRLQIVGGPPPEAFPDLLEARFNTAAEAFAMADRVDAMMGNYKDQGFAVQVISDRLGLVIARGSGV